MPTSAEILESLDRQAENALLTARGRRVFREALELVAILLLAASIGTWAFGSPLLGAALFVAALFAYSRT